MQVVAQRQYACDPGRSGAGKRPKTASKRPRKSRTRPLVSGLWRRESTLSPRTTMRQAHGLDSSFTTMYATGGGAHKFKDVIEKALDCRLTACSELGTVVLGAMAPTCSCIQMCVAYCTAKTCRRGWSDVCSADSRCARWILR
eukprot:scaffold180021_cov35-Tisochrysis_lutea.AAC.2